jgi:hypothetical protein
MPKVDAASWCLMSKDASMPMCPSGFSTRLVLYATADIADGRQCDACSCTSNATSCTNQKLTVYKDNTCTNGVDVNLAANCANFPGAAPPDITGWDHFKYRATPSPADCSPAMAAVALTGGVTGNNPATICCP